MKLLSGDKGYRWKGDKVGYRGLHHWMKKEFGKAFKCEFCGKTRTTPKSIQWANKTGKYLRDRNDWLELCASCHKKYDLNLK